MFLEAAEKFVCFAFLEKPQLYEMGANRCREMGGLFSATTMASFCSSKVVYMSSANWKVGVAIVRCGLQVNEAEVKSKTKKKER